ncbi:MGH1-like glycoside hydrolase domain-containing protein [Methylobacterium durans]|uniref:Glucosidase n=1 Tax=Methylobacterium durans TaxID=2202825 RepID=A0A2U8W568_9HYPH|nr:glucosidase [Methylobacterium durans]AWN41264.1 glucosidase [Methylobacterium durans]
MPDPGSGACEAPRIFETAEGARLALARTDPAWRRWGPYLSERQWGTVREDYSAGGDAWDYLPHDHARSRAYRWGEDGIGGFGDTHLNWCLSLALWNERDPILKERLFGLTNQEGNHGEDVKELYYYLDGTPTHSLMRMLYKYPQAAFPYERLVAENRARGLDDPEFEILDTGAFDENRYFDVEIAYAKAAPDDVLMRVTIANRGPEPAPLRVLPQLFARNVWSWRAGALRPELSLDGDRAVRALHPSLGPMRLHVEGPAELLFTENDTNEPRLFGVGDPGGFYKDGIGRYLVEGERGAVNPARHGTKCAALHRLDLGPGESRTLRLRFRPSGTPDDPFADFDAVFAEREAEADAFYAALQAGIADPDLRSVQRQALAGMLWSKQLYHYDVREWLAGDPAQPAPPESRKSGRNSDWAHVRANDIISMPDAWEYPWFASWDLALQSLVLAMIDPDFAKGQILLLIDEAYTHPNAALPAYEWGFSDANPPLHAWAAWRVFELDRALTGVPDHAFLKRAFNKLALNFTWWVNRKDAAGHNLFQGGFLGLDNIGIFDRSKPLANGDTLTQSDATAWMAMFAINLLRVAIEIAPADPAYEDMAEKFFEHFLLIAAATGEGVWEERDGFFYDVIETAGGERRPIRVRTMVGLIPIFAVAVLSESDVARLPRLVERLRFFLVNRPDLARLVSRWNEPGQGRTALLSLLRGHRLKALLRRMLDPAEFLSDHGIRAVSRVYADAPFRFPYEGRDLGLAYEPAESRSRLFGGNSNWRGPVWMPVNYLLIESLHRFHGYYGPDFRVEAPTGSGKTLSLQEVADDLSRRLVGLSTRGPAGRPVYGDSRIEQDDPHFRDHVLFYEYYHGDTGRGLGASHQTGWSGLVALLIQQCAIGTADKMHR